MYLMLPETILIQGINPWSKKSSRVENYEQANTRTAQWIADIASFTNRAVITLEESMEIFLSWQVSFDILLDENLLKM